MMTSREIEAADERRRAELNALIRPSRDRIRKIRAAAIKTRFWVPSKGLPLNWAEFDAAVRALLPGRTKLIADSVVSCVAHRLGVTFKDSAVPLGLAAGSANLHQFRLRRHGPDSPLGRDVEMVAKELEKFRFQFPRVDKQ